MATTFVSLLLDESGSMGSVLDETISGVNTYFDELRKDLEGNSSVYFTKFDSQGTRDICNGVSVEQVPTLSRDNYQPRSMTPLVDAAMDIIQRTEDAVNAKKNPDKHKAIVVIQTDGHENASRRFNASQLKEKVQEMQAKDNWEIVFIGAGIDTFDAVQSYGFIAGNAMSYTQDSKGIGSTVRSVAGNATAYAAGASGMAFTSEQRDDAGEEEVTGRRRKGGTKEGATASSNAS